ncbi:MAG: tRNA methyltransferase ppm2 [Bathelium mastoideum]|nr:MAG: tRNA methyltransferase ppm2 [Bathelium mastoideum]
MDPKKKSGPTARNDSQKRDEAVMETNNSCIVSKRSVERLYRSNEPEFLRYFVKKYQRRSPLINRGYCEWEGCRKIRPSSFFASPSDPLPFRFLKLHPKLCSQATFIDVDYPILMKKKREIILNTDPLCEDLDGLDTHNPQDVILVRANRYIGLGCDLKQLDGLTKVLEEQVHIGDCAVLFLAEVSMTYMQPVDADSVIQWGSRFGDEQHLPSGPDHPFAQTMLRHFEKLRSPLLVLNQYPKVQDQRTRFLDRGWVGVDVTDLWSLWGHDEFLKPDERRALDFIEPFDEWEEFALFGGHYFVLVATTNSAGENNALLPVSPPPNGSPLLRQYDAKLICKTYQNGQCYRRFGAAMIIQQEEELPDLIGYHGGLGQKSRLTTCDIYTDLSLSNQFKGPPEVALMNHTITYHRDSKYLFVGGRSSPDKAGESCWLQDKGHWEDVDSLRPGRFRHCAVQARLQMPHSRHRINGVVVFGGRTSHGDVLGDWMFWDDENGWRRIEPHNEVPEARFGASIWASAKSISTSGYMTGGMRCDGTVIQDLWKWQLVCEDGLGIVCQNLTKHLDHAGARGVFGRFGAALIRSEWGMLLLGGITSGLPPGQEHEALIFEDKSEEMDEVSLSRLHLDIHGPRPLFVGFGIASVQDHGIVILGGGATCFSFGTHWNTGCYTLTDQEEMYGTPWHADEQHMLYARGERRDGDVSTNASSRGSSVINDTLPKLKELENLATQADLPGNMQIPRVSVSSSLDFEHIVARAQPVILDHLPLGSCTANWDTVYLKEKIGPSRDVVVHSSPSNHMNFQAKNFAYITMPFGEFLDSVESGGKLYLRALSSQKPAKRATNLTEDYPEIAADFSLPPELGLVNTNMHSSPLRISGPVSMWLHYDVMANVLCQIKGRKRLVLFPPSDVQHLDFAPGASSSEVNVFAPDLSTNPQLAHTHPHEAMLGQGDVLFIPAFWMHAAAPTDGTSIAVNVFFRNLDKGYATGKDVYGNRDLEAYERGRQEIGKLVKLFDHLPLDVRNFYLQRLSDELRERIGSTT